MKLRYKRSILGVGWSLLNPLAQLMVFRFVFEQVLPVNIPNYTPFLFTGILVWSWFQTSLILATTSVVDNRELIKRPGFPMGIVPMVTIASNLIHFLLALPILYVLLISGGVSVTSSAFILPVIIAIQFGLTLGVAYFVTTFHVAFRDTQYLLAVALQLLFFLTPIFYDVASIPERYHWLYNVNPMASLIDAYRSVLLRGQVPGQQTLLMLGLLTIVLLSLGYLVFRRASHHFAEEL